MAEHKMNSHELGLILGKQLLGIDKLHYGLWEEDIPTSLSNITLAQQRYIDMLGAFLPRTNRNEIQLLDVGHGDNYLLDELLDRDYKVDALCESPLLAKQTLEKIQQRQNCASKLFNTSFCTFPVDHYLQYYDAVIFSDSFQKTKYELSIAVLERIIKPGGIAIICDFFPCTRDSSEPSNASRKRIFNKSKLKKRSQKQTLQDFHQQIKLSSFALSKEVDITSQIMPNLVLMDKYMSTYVKPVGETLSQYLVDNHPFISKALQKIFARKIQRIASRYLSGTHMQSKLTENERYQIIVIQLVKPV